METYKKQTITFDSEFFGLLKERWLKPIEIYTLLENAEELIRNNFIELFDSKILHNNIENKDYKNKVSYFLILFHN